MRLRESLEGQRIFVAQDDGGWIHLDGRHAPLIVTTIRGFIRGALYATALEHRDALYASFSGAFVLIFDALGENGATPDMRKAQAEWNDRNRPMLARRNVCVVFALDDAMKRGMVTATHWLEKPPYRHRICDSRWRALDIATQELTRSGEPLPPGYLTLLTPPRAPLFS